MTSEPVTIASLLIDWIEVQLQSHTDTPLLCISGSQGIGKSTALKQVEAHFAGRIATLGLDDFYLTKAERARLAENVHDLFSVRGPAGTHDLDLLNTAIDALRSAVAGDVTPIPVFDKRIDDRLPKEDWHGFTGRPAAILLEGWCVGALADPAASDEEPLNAVEQADARGIWRQYQEAQLAGDYAQLWDRADAFFHLCAPSFEQVLNWRTQQEETTLGLAHGTLPEERKAWVSRFIQHYERVTRRMMNGGRRGGYALSVTPDRQPVLPANSSAPLIVFSDLDGTLLDHETYSYEAANDALKALTRIGAVLVLASSKTAAEMAGLRQALGFEHCPAIVENGSGILEPGDDAEGAEHGTYQRLIGALNSLPAELRAGFQGFSDWSVETVAARTGLELEAAARAKERRFSEPGLWSGTAQALEAFTAQLAQYGIEARKGGRFLTLSYGHTKADRMFEIMSRYRPVPTIALGDAPNDAEMIASANYGVIINNPHGAGLGVLAGAVSGNIMRTTEAGPVGWNRAILDLLTRLNLA